MSTQSYPSSPVPPVPLIGDGIPVPCADGIERPYLSMDTAASTAALGQVAARVQEFLPWYSSVHRGAGYKSQLATTAYEDARSAALAFAGRAPGHHRHPDRRMLSAVGAAARSPRRRRATELLVAYQQRATELARLRRVAIEDAHRDLGMSYSQVAAAMGITKGRIPQIRGTIPAPGRSP